MENSMHFLLFHNCFLFIILALLKLPVDVRSRHKRFAGVPGILLGASACGVSLAFRSNQQGAKSTIIFNTAIILNQKSPLTGGFVRNKKQIFFVHSPKGD
jgi:hypothetical protein